MASPKKENSEASNEINEEHYSENDEFIGKQPDNEKKLFDVGPIIEKATKLTKAIRNRANSLGYILTNEKNDSDSDESIEEE